MSKTKNATNGNEQVLSALFQTIEERKGADPSSSYTAKLFDKGANKIGGKIGEEAAELAMALVSENPKAVAEEAADLFYHTFVGMAARGVSLDRVVDVLKERQGISGLTVQAQRQQEDTITSKDREEGDRLLINFNKRGGLVPAIAQDAESGVILMQAYMNKEAFEKTLEVGQAVYWSTSRNEIWHKGATSGQFQEVVEILTDCDQDSIILRVNQLGDAACHTGRQSCFYRAVDMGGDKPSLVAV